MRPVVALLGLAVVAGCGGGAFSGRSAEEHGVESGAEQDADPPAVDAGGEVAPAQDSAPPDAPAIEASADAPDDALDAASDAPSDAGMVDSGSDAPLGVSCASPIEHGGGATPPATCGNPAAPDYYCAQTGELSGCIDVQVPGITPGENVPDCRDDAGYPCCIPVYDSTGTPPRVDCVCWTCPPDQ